jgi:hypothetical protein
MIRSNTAATPIGIRLIADGADAEALAVAEANVVGAKKLLERTLIDQGRTKDA